jgi:hypothetical protein
VAIVAQPVVADANETPSSTKPGVLIGRPVVATVRTRLPSVRLTTRLPPSGNAIQCVASTIATGIWSAGAKARRPVIVAALCQVLPPLWDARNDTAGLLSRRKVTGSTARVESLNVGSSASGSVERNPTGPELRRGATFPRRRIPHRVLLEQFRF